MSEIDYETQTAKIEAVISAVRAELSRACSRFPTYRSAHEAIGIIREEYLEFENSVFHESGEAQFKEAKQLAAMAARFMLDINTQGAEKPTDITGDEWQPAYGFVQADRPHYGQCRECKAWEDRGVHKANCKRGYFFSLLRVK